MNWRKHMVLVVGGGLALLLLLVALGFLLSARGNHAKSSEELQQAMRRLEALMQRKPFPSPENVRHVEANLAAVADQAQALQEGLRRGALNVESIEAAEFAPLLERAVKRLSQQAAELGVALPAPFNLGLDRYAAGELPASEHLPRLVLQLRSMEAISQLLFQSRISSLVSIERQPFEFSSVPGEEPVMSARRRSTVQEAGPYVSLLPPPPSNALYVVERITVTFLARDAIVWEVLNQIARSPLVMAVVDVQLENTSAQKGELGKAQPAKATGAGVPEGQIAAMPSHEDRVVAGREPVQAQLVVDVYRFADAIKEGGS